jgi:hypothetical protein
MDFTALTIPTDRDTKRQPWAHIIQSGLCLAMAACIAGHAQAQTTAESAIRQNQGWTTPGHASGALPPTTAAQRRARPATAASIAQSHEEQLANIRQAILEATVDRPTRVLSTAWVDDQGALHESTHFNSEADVRGVRVLSYLEDGKEPQTRVSAQVLPWGWRHGKDASACDAPPRPWRLPLQVQASMDSSFTGSQLFAAQSLLHLSRQVWRDQLQASQRWRPHVKELPPANSYLRALTGPSEGVSGWAAEVTIKPHAKAEAEAAPGGWLDKLQTLYQPAQEAGWRWSLSVRIGERHSPDGPLQAHWKMTQVLRVSPQALSQNPSAWIQQMQAHLEQALRGWVQELDKHSGCEPVQFHVRTGPLNNLLLQAGADSGLRPGDRLLIMNPAQVPKRMLEAGAAQHLALAQVVKVGTDLVELKQLAGPTLPAQSHWMALPL